MTLNDYTPPIPSKPPFTNLDDYTEAVSDEMNLILEVTSENDLLSGYKAFTKEQQLDDMKTYYLMYKAAQIQYGVPIAMLYATHAQETGTSRHERPDNLTYRGAMQRDFTIYSDKTAEQSASGWEFLSNLKQRYPTDYREIMFAAWKMRKDADDIRKINPSLSFDQSVKLAQYRYCAEWVADVRNSRYEYIKSIFDQALRSKSLRPKVNRRKMLLLLGYE